MIAARALPTTRMGRKWLGNERYDCVTSNYNGQDQGELKWVPPGLHSQLNQGGKEKRGGPERSRSFEQKAGMSRSAEASINVCKILKSYIQNNSWKETLVKQLSEQIKKSAAAIYCRQSTSFFIRYSGGCLIIHHMCKRLLRSGSKQSYRIVYIKSVTLSKGSKMLL